MCIPLSPEAASALKSFDRIPDSQAGLPRAVAEELLRVGLAYESPIGGVVNMTAAGRLWLSSAPSSPRSSSPDLAGQITLARPD